MTLKNKKYESGGYIVEYVPYGIANRFENNRIEINERLLHPYYYELHEEIIEHEKKHTDKGWKLSDFYLDLKGFKNRRQYFKFIITNPSSWIQFSPIYKSKGKTYVDYSLILFWLIMFYILLQIWNLTQVLS